MFVYIHTYIHTYTLSLSLSRSLARSLAQVDPRRVLDHPCRFVDASLQEKADALILARKAAGGERHRHRHRQRERQRQRKRKIKREREREREAIMIACSEAVQVSLLLESHISRSLFSTARGLFLGLF